MEIMFLYADDTSLLIKGRTQNELQNNRRNTTEGMKKWFTSNNLKINDSKTQELTFKIRGGKKENAVKFLGLYINEKLCWSEQVNVTAKKLSTAIYSIRRIKQISTRHAALLTYHANFHSIASYGIMFWGMSTEAGRIFRLQKRAIRVLANLKPRETCREAFKELKILTIPSQYILTTLMYVHENKHKYQENGDPHNYATRRRHDLQVPLHRTKTTQGYTDYWGVHLYNKIPLHIRNLCVKRFKKTVKKMLIQHVFYSVQEFLESEQL